MPAADAGGQLVGEGEAGEGEEGAGIREEDQAGKFMFMVRYKVSFTLLCIVLTLQ